MIQLQVYITYFGTDLLYEKHMETLSRKQKQDSVA